MYKHKHRTGSSLSEFLASGLRSTYSMPVLKKGEESNHHQHVQHKEHRLFSHDSKPNSLKKVKGTIPPFKCSLTRVDLLPLKKKVKVALNARGSFLVLVGPDTLV